MSRILDTDIKLYEPDPGTGFPDITRPELTKINMGIFPRVEIKAGNVHIVYRKVFMFNHNQGNQLIAPELEIIANPHNLFSIAADIPGAPLPSDADDINVNAGNGPGIFTTGILYLSNILPNDGVAFWIKRFVYWGQKETLAINLAFQLRGESDNI